MVLVHHYTYQLSPEIQNSVAGLHFFHNGVELFFVLTGFLFAPIMLGEKSLQSGYYKRRFFRIYPVYFLSLLVIVVSVLDTPPSWFVFIQHVLLIQTLPYNSLPDASAISLVYWTLSTEIQFYVFLALLVLLYSKVPIVNKMRFLLILSVAGFVASSYYQTNQSNPTWLLWQVQLPALLIEFFLGVVVYRYRKLLQGYQAAILFVASVLLLIGLYQYYPIAVKEAISPRPFGLFNLLSAMGYAGVVASLLVILRQIPSAVAVSLLTTGAISYPLYLFHGITLDWVNALALPNESRIGVALMGALLIAYLVHKLIEVPCRDYGRK
jgi:peptidoglycan/LPS O-acetylase OafA/YrhL